MTMHYSVAYYIFIISSIIILKSYGKEKTEQNLGVFFFIIGSLVNYLEWYAQPLLTLGMPMVFLCMLWIKDNQPLIKQFIQFIKLSLTWTAGYCFTWVSKWILGSIILKRNIVAEATGRVEMYKEFSGFSLQAVLYCIRVNLDGWICIFKKSPKGKYLVVEIALILFLVIYYKYLKGYNIDKEKLFKSMHKCLCLFMVALYPFVWCIADTGHTIWHQWWCFRLFMITFCAIGYICMYVYKNSRGHKLGNDAT